MRQGKPKDVKANADDTAAAEWPWVSSDWQVPPAVCRQYNISWEDARALTGEPTLDSPSPWATWSLYLGSFARWQLVISSHSCLSSFLCRVLGSLLGFKMEEGENKLKRLFVRVSSVTVCQPHPYYYTYQSWLRHPGLWKAINSPLNKNVLNEGSTITLVKQLY